MARRSHASGQCWARHAPVLLALALAAAHAQAYVHRYIDSANVCALYNKQTRKIEMAEGDDNYGITVQLTSQSTISNKLYNLSCKFEVQAPKGFYLFVVIEKMYFRMDDRHNCIDSIKFKRHGVETEPLCGKRSPGDLLVNPVVDHLANTDMINMFQDTSKGLIKVYVNIGPKYRTEGPYQHLNPPETISLDLVFTAFKGCSQLGVFREWKPCPGYDNYCINDNLVCDNHINCGQGSTNDESECAPEIASSGQLPAFVFVLILVGLLIVAILLFGAIRHLKRGNRCCCKTVETVNPSARHRQYQRGSSPTRPANRRHNTNSASEPSAPPNISRPAPPPEETHLEDFSVIPHESAPVESGALHLEHEAKEDLPPSYASLFPEGASSSTS